MRSKNIEISTTNKLLTTIKVMTNDIDLVKESITEAVTKAPALFTDLAVELSFESSVMTEELVKIISIVESHGIKVALLSGVPQEASKLLNIGHYDQQATKSVKEITSGEEEICNTSIRSGQVIEAKGRSVIIFGNVNSGAEIRAGRSIYVFGNINGRVFAGCDSSKANLERITFFGGKPEVLQIGNLLITADDLANATFTKPMVATIVSSTINLSEI